MKVVMLEAPEGFIAERRAKGLDIRDEVWEGVLHMVPQPGYWHQRFGFELAMALEPHAKARGLALSQETTLSRAGEETTNYRVPDWIVTRPEQRTARGATGAEIVIENLSPGDESHDKLPFYADLGVKEVFFFDPDTRGLELYVLRGGRLLATTSDSDGLFHSEIVGVSFQKIDGPKLLVRWKGGEVTI